MSIPGFFSLFNSQRSLQAAQTALSTVNHNISNANTAGFSRQRLDLQATDPYSPSTLSNFSQAQIGQGVDIQGITRSHDAFLAEQFRTETSTQGNINYASQVAKQLEAVVNEPSDTGLRSSVQRLFESIQNLTTNPESLASRTAFLQQANDVLSVAQQQGSQLLGIHNNLVGSNGQPSSFPSSQLGVIVSDVNTKLGQVANLNKQILSVSASGGAPNDLLDQRDLLLNQLSSQINFNITKLPNDQVQIDIDGNVLVKSTRQLDSLQLIANTGLNADAVPIQLSTVTGAVNVTSVITDGRVRGILDIAGDAATGTTVYGLFNQINDLLETISTAFNTLQAAGRDLGGVQNATGTYANIIDTDVSYPGTGPRLQYLRVNTSLLNDVSKLALAADDASFTGNFGGVSDNRNALALLGVRDTNYAALNNQTPDSFHQTVVAQLGIDVKSYKDRNDSQANLIQSLEQQQQAISGVNLNEESIDLLRYQRQFEATSRIIKSLDEVYKTIINLT